MSDRSAYRKAVDAWIKHAKSLGFDWNRHKIYGDDAFRKRSGDYIKLHGARDGKLQIFRQGVGRYEIQIE